VHDRVIGTTVLASHATGIDGAMGNGESFGADLGRRELRGLCLSEPTNLAPRAREDDREVLVRDLRGNTTTLVASGANDPSISADGRNVAFDGTTSGSRPFQAVLQVLVRGLRTNRTVLVSRARCPRGAAGNGDSGIRFPSRPTGGGSRFSRGRPTSRPTMQMPACSCGNSTRSGDGGGAGPSQRRSGRRASNPATFGLGNSRSEADSCCFAAILFI
jgi:hypothetical protein